MRVQNTMISLLDCLFCLISSLLPRHVCQDSKQVFSMMLQGMLSNSLIARNWYIMLLTKCFNVVANSKSH